jgi:translation elongation factor EF-G
MNVLSDPREEEFNEKETKMLDNYSGPIIWASIEPNYKEDYAKLATIARLVGEQDHSLVVKCIVPGRPNEKYPKGIVLVNAMGELHLETAIARIAHVSRFDGFFSVNIGKSQIFYLEDESGTTLEPIMTLEVEAPIGCAISITNDLEARGANRDKTQWNKGRRILKFSIPLSGVLGYAVDLRKLPDGKATATIVFSHYAPCKPKEEFEPPLDEGIKVYVETLRAGGIETYESCQGGEGHSYLRPAVRFHGGKGEGFRALAIAQQHGFRVRRLNRMWSIEDDEPTGPYWEMVFWDRK